MVFMINITNTTMCDWQNLIENDIDFSAENSVLYANIPLIKFNFQNLAIVHNLKFK